jgi:2-polyprenyl-3-methyl-5-hydroxy-6-metoxy-1,4-benzoquinol methylase
MNLDLSTNKLYSSFRDPSGFLFKRDGILYRQVNLCYQKDYELLLSSGLLDSLFEKGMLIPHKEVDVQAQDPEISYKILQPDYIPFISYPYEWSFSQLKDAALLTLAIQKEALSFGLTLKDASAYNIQFYNGEPIFIDSLSFSVYNDGMPWLAYYQFCKHFLAPLALMRYSDLYLGRIQQLYIDGIPLALAAKLLPKHTQLNLGLTTHLHLHARFEQLAHKKALTPKAKLKINKDAVIGLVNSLEKTINSLIYKPTKQGWSDYYDQTNYSGQAFNSKINIITNWLHLIMPGTVLDVGANTGVFSRLAADIANCRIVSTDNDPYTVNLNYLSCKKSGIRNILPLVIDLTNPTPSIGWQNRERQSFLERGTYDVILALAVFHHLVIGNNLPIKAVVKQFSEMCKHLLIEFVPKEDSQVQRLLASRDDIFHDYTRDQFVNMFCERFKLIDEMKLEDSQRWLFWFELRN